MATNLFKAVIVGAGPAGLTAAYELSKRKQPVVVLESDPEYVGGISRTVNYKGFHFDIGGHRFFSKSREVEDLWTEIAGDLMLERPRSSRIFYRGQFYSYPLKAFEALTKLGLIESVRCMASFAAARLRPTPNPKTFEDWVVNQFGERLFRIFFKTYTEKVWGMSCREISADWAAQRIKGLSLGSAMKHALLPQRKPQGPQGRGQDPDRHLPLSEQGPGMMWEACAKKVRAHGWRGASRTQGHRDAASTHRRSTGSSAPVPPSGTIEQFEGEHLVSSMPIRELVAQIEPQLPPAATQGRPVLALSRLPDDRAHPARQRPLQR